MPSRPGQDRSLLLTAGGDAVTVNSSCRPLLDWLVEFWSPWLIATEATDAPTARVRIDIDAERFAATLDGSAATGKTVHCFTLDHGRDEWHLRRAANGPIAVDDEMRVGLWSSGDEVPEVELLAASDGGNLRLAALRVVRELISVQAFCRGSMPVHASAVAHGEGVTLFVGPKGAGKTTNLVAALERAGTSYVANDRVLVDRTDAGYRVRGTPTIVAMRSTMLALFPRLGAEIGSGAWHFASTVAEALAYRKAGVPAPNPFLQRPPGVSPAQLCAMLECTPVAAGEIERVVFPTSDGSQTKGFSLERLDPEDAAARIAVSGLVAGGRIAPPFLTRGSTTSAPRLAEELRAFARTVPCFEGALGLGPAPSRPGQRHALA